MGYDEPFEKAISRSKQIERWELIILSSFTVATTLVFPNILNNFTNA